MRKKSQNYLERLYPIEFEIRISFCSCLAVTGMNTIKITEFKNNLVTLDRLVA